MQKNGFTLIELTVVLVIISLLIGGVIAGQGLIQNSKNSKQVAQFQQFDAAVSNFKGEYGYLPGDATQFGGDGDGIIDQTSTGTDNRVNKFMIEHANFWISLDPEQFPGPTANGLVSTSSTGIKANTTGLNKNVPFAEGGKEKSFVVASAPGAAVTYLTAVNTNKTNYYVILGSTQIQTTTAGSYAFVPTTSANSSFKPRELAALDKKIDDGLANSGSVISGSIWNRGASDGGVGTIPNTGLCNTAGAYNVNSTLYECTPLIRIGAQAGSPL